MKNRLGAYLMLAILAAAALLVSCGKPGPCGYNYVEIYDPNDGRLVDCIHRDLYYENGDNITDVEYDVDPELEQYLVNFVAIAKLKGIDLSYIYDEKIVIKFTDYDNRNHVATAFNRDEPGIIIRVHRQRFMDRSEQGRKYVMYHEFGHDILNLPHSENVDMMRPTAFTGFFKPGRFSDERQDNYLYKSLNQMFNKFLGNE